MRVHGRRAEELETQGERLVRLLTVAADLLRRGKKALDRGGVRDLARAAHDERRLAVDLEVAALDFLRTQPRGGRVGALELYRRERDLAEAVAVIAEAIEAHRINLHEPLTGAQQGRAGAALERVALRLTQSARWFQRPATEPHPRHGVTLDRQWLQAEVQAELATLEEADTPPRRASWLTLLTLKESDRALAALQEILYLDVPVNPARPAARRDTPEGAAIPGVPQVGAVG